MLSYPDRNTFEEIRARWESGQPAKDTTSVMVGSRERQLIQQPTNDGPPTDSGSKFRRKLSHGLAFISNPLSQRRTTSGRHQAILPSQAVSQSAMTAELIQTHKRDVSLSPRPELTSVKSFGRSPTTTATLANTYCSTDPDLTPKPLLRSRTLSFIPRPIRAESQSFVTDVEQNVEVEASPLMNSLPSHSTPLGIPIPSPILSERRHSSPRQYSLYEVSRSAKNVTTALPFTAIRNRSLSKLAIRSHTTPNLVTTANLSQRSTSIVSMRTESKKLNTSPAGQKSVLQENAPTITQAQQRRIRIQYESSTRNSFALPGAKSRGITSGFHPSPGSSEQSRLNAPPSGSKRVSSQVAKPILMTVPRIKTLSPRLPRTVTDTLSAKHRPQGCRYPLTPTPLTRNARRKPQPVLKPSEALHRKGVGTSNSLGGIWRSSRALTVPKNEVRRLPRSYTFHNFGSYRDSAPPVPSIPEQYRTPSVPELSECVLVDSGNSVVPQPLQVIMGATSSEFVVEENGEGEQSNILPASPRWDIETEGFGWSECSTSKNDLAIPPVVFPVFNSFASQESVWTEDLAIHHLCSPDNRSWSIYNQCCQENADVDFLLQVNDYMPTPYWAGRFQSRFDQWRTEAMIAELNPNHSTNGLLSEFKLHQEKSAICYIFAQLRELCTSIQAADSLWEFEFRYRRDNKLFGDPIDLLGMPIRRHDDLSIHKAAFVRAVRRLTPRKNSLVNLLKGKGWNKGEEKSDNTPETVIETSSRSS